MVRRVFRNGTAVLPGRLLPGCVVVVDGDRISAVGTAGEDGADEVIDLAGGYLLPGFVDLHVHGGAGADFMDGTADAFRTVCRAHARHGTTALLATSTAAAPDDIRRFLENCRRMKSGDTGGARVLGAHLYGPYFQPAARGCHPAADIRSPAPADFEDVLAYADCIVTASVAPELPGAEAFVRACRTRGVRCNAGHSHATFAEVEAAIGWGVRHVDHLFCAMSDRARLRATQAYPMRAGLLEATLALEDLTTEVIADGQHLDRGLLLLAYKAKGPDRLALVTDAMRGLDMPDGEYWFGAIGRGERVRRLGNVGVTLDGSGLASGVTGLDHAVRTFAQLTRVPLPDVVRMASLTPARIAGVNAELGSLEPGKRADLIATDEHLAIRETFIGGRIRVVERGE